jgi:endoglucanase
MGKFPLLAPLLAIGLGMISLSGCAGPPPADASAAQTVAPAPFPMRTCVNLGNALEAPREGEWGYRIRNAHLDAIANAGFDGVRLPVRWDAHATTSAPYAIEPAFMDRVAQVVDAALARGLSVQLDMHHYEALNAAPEGPEALRFVAMWDQIGERFADRSPELMFELLNEPYGDHWTPEALQRLQAGALAAVRRTNPDRLVVLGGLAWGNVHGLEGWTPPADAGPLAVSVHHYGPHAFTHQNAEWLGDDAPQWPRVWGTPADHSDVERVASRAAAEARRLGLPMQLGEFGVITEAPLDQRLRWLRSMRTAFGAQGIGWCVWDFAAAFRIYDTRRGAFEPGALEALGLREDPSLASAGAPAGQGRSAPSP